MVFNGTFDSTLSKYKAQFGNCFSMLNANEELFSITNKCDPGGGGLFRSDINSPNIYPAGVPECTTIPINFAKGDPGSVNTDNTWLVFAESEDPYNPNQNDAGSWGMGLTSYYNGGGASAHNQWDMTFTGYNSGAPAWTGPNVSAGWHTLSLCTNNANNNTGTIYGIWFDGVRQTINHGPAAGAQSLSGFPQIQNDPGNNTNWPLIIDDYTGGSPTNQLIHGAPLVTRMGPNGLPPQQAGGWNAP
jgi:hypothetical protein